VSDYLLLSLLWLVPLVGAAAVLCLPERSAGAAKWVSLAATLATSALTCYALFAYTADHSRAGRPLAERVLDNTLVAAAPRGDLDQARESAGGGDRDLVVRRSWVPGFGIEYYLGLDGISLSLVMLNGLVSVLSCLASWRVGRRPKAYFALFLLLTSSLMGVFLALDLFLFYVFFEVMLLPMYFLIAVWGGENREYAAVKFLLYTLFGSVFLLVAILILYFYPGDTPAPGFDARTFDLVRVTGAAGSTGYYGRAVQGWVFLLLVVGFGVKLPTVPFHTWLPDAHVEAPTPISMMLAGVLLKVGGYGLVRIAWPLAPRGAETYCGLVVGLGVVSILYGALLALAQTDFKKLVAYSSVSHMGYVMLGMAALPAGSDPRSYAFGVSGAVFMMLAHGVTSTGMFFLAGVVGDRTGTRDLRAMGGLLNLMPLCGAASFLIFFGSMGLPGLCGFVAEVFVVLAAFDHGAVTGVLAASAIVLTAGYILWTLQRVFLGRSEPGRVAADLTPREVLIAAPLVALTVALGVFPQALVLRWVGPSVNEVVRSVIPASGPIAGRLFLDRRGEIGRGSRNPSTPSGTSLTAPWTPR